MGLSIVQFTWDTDPVFKVGYQHEINFRFSYDQVLLMHSTNKLSAVMFLPQFSNDSTNLVTTS